MFIKLKECRTKLGFTIEKLIELTGLSKAQLNNIQAGKGQTLHNVKKLADAMNIYPDELLPDDWKEPGKAHEFDIDVLAEILAYVDQHPSLRKAHYKQKAAAIKFCSDFSRSKPTQWKEKLDEFFDMQNKLDVINK
jgi:transcriptional regulator with XRE-family HTH domain